MLHYLHAPILRHYTEVSGNFLAPAALPPGEIPPTHYTLNGSPCGPQSRYEKYPFFVCQYSNPGLSIPSCSRCTDSCTLSVSSSLRTILILSSLLLGVIPSSLSCPIRTMYVTSFIYPTECTNRLL